MIRCKQVLRGLPMLEGSLDRFSRIESGLLKRLKVSFRR